MTAHQQSPEQRKVKTLAIRLEPELHAQLSVIAQLRGSSLAEEIRTALSAHVASQATSTDLAGSAATLLEDIEREAAERREALTALLGTPPETSTARRSGKRSAPNTTS